MPTIRKKIVPRLLAMAVRLLVKVIAECRPSIAEKWQSSRKSTRKKTEVLAREPVRPPEKDRAQQRQGDHLLAVVEDSVELAVDEVPGESSVTSSRSSAPVSRSLVSAVTPWALIRTRLRMARPTGIRHSDAAQRVFHALAPG